ncbi:MAG: hypothetical protein DRQ44_05795 [Gammaproteobacteria bacterium]|nr:MAG: hypothetical protein DRQ44_05795 [Gammaproteobacteria bacterium]
MKRILTPVVLSAVLALGACASAPTIQTRYELDANDQLVQRQYTTTDTSGACTTGGFNWCVAGAITAGVLIGVWGLDRIFNDDNESTSTTVTPYQSPLVPASGFSTTTTTNEFDNEFITPGYVTVN